MRVAYFDCIGGASGDMLLGALIDAGASIDVVRSAIDRLRLPDCEVHTERVMKGALSALQATVKTPRQATHRHYTDLVAIISAADLPDAIKAKALAILRRVGEVEAGIHGEPLESIHLHELGGDDTLIDLVGALLALADLKIDRVCVSTLPLARGWTTSQHGQLPLPAPATLALLKDAPVRYVDRIEAELVTPTGAALLTSLADQYGGFPSMTLRSIGVGAGRRDMPFPNVLRVLIGERADDGLISETLTVLETNIDDLNPQVYEHVMQRLFEAGALDVTLTPIHMKKNRPAVTLSVVCQPAKAQALIKLVLSETTTLGVRQQTIERVSLPRSIETVDTPYGSIRVKVARWDNVARAVPEYDDCRQAAEEHGVPLMTVMEAARHACA
ncbi:MAG: nickel pincer cofactor biosynthesis protein LarC [Chloroflexi bacterium]|nr:nickel pincer cofactor biosynthesis protein LarC [Chloroflexota bacterium]